MGKFEVFNKLKNGKYKKKSCNSLKKGMYTFIHDSVSIHPWVFPIKNTKIKRIFSMNTKKETFVNKELNCVVVIVVTVSDYVIFNPLLK